MNCQWHPPADLYVLTPIRKNSFNRYEPAFFRARKECVHQPLVPWGVGSDQAVFASVHAFYGKRLARFELVLMTKLCRSDDLTPG